MTNSPFVRARAIPPRQYCFARCRSTAWRGRRNISIREVNTLNRDLHAEDFCRERHGEVVFQHRVERHPLFFLAVGINERFFDEPVELRRSKTGTLYPRI